MATSPVTWSRAWRAAAHDFWSEAQPSAHFTTSAGVLVADRVAALVHEVDEALGCPSPLHVIDVGCGDGDLLALVRERCDDLADRVRWVGIDMRPVHHPGIESVLLDAPGPAPFAPVQGLVMAHEWLDEIPCDIVERDDAGVDRIVLVDRDGAELLGPPLRDDTACAEHGVDSAQARAWLERWWPLREPGDRAEIGTARDAAWQWMGSLLSAGTALATDYGHVSSERIDRHPHGTLAAYASGRLVRPVPDGTVNLTAHVALDSCAAALPGTTLTSQRDEIADVPLGEQPSAGDMERHFASLRLRDRARLGGVGWLRWDAHRDGSAPASTLPMW